ncbi:head-to-tail adaptor [Streptomyces phage Mischief19]|nr:head-to-tail adaptor [Streptomyces phage Mischief19]
MIPSLGPCAPLDLDRDCFDVPDGTTEETIAKWQRVASDYLRAMTGNHYGQSCPVIVRPCYGSCNGSSGDGWWFSGPLPLGYSGPFYPYRGGDGLLRNWRGCGCKTDLCHCGAELCRLPLPGPIHTVNSIYINGVLLPNDHYTIQDARWLVRANPPGNDPLDPLLGTCWPECQDYTNPVLVGADGNHTFAVEYTTGVGEPPILRAAMSSLTAHFIRGCDGCGCGVGTRQNLSRMSRQGVDLEFADAQQVFTDGRTGIELVDWAIRALNPSGLPRAMRVLSPDMPQRPIYRG